MQQVGADGAVSAEEIYCGEWITLGNQPLVG
jgi:hypothetical protein